jgi:predicted peptidase
MPGFAGLLMTLSLNLWPFPAAPQSAPAVPQSTPASIPVAGAPGSDQRPATGFLYKTLTIDGQIQAYGVYVPPDYTPERPWPVILFLHGAGERGIDGFLQTEVGIGHAIRRNYRLVPAIVVMPQCPPKEDWTGRMSGVALRCVEQTSREYRLDGDRVYLTGLSLGGQGVWNLGAGLPDRFAAIVPICGFAEYDRDTGVAAKLAARLTRVPIWCFHGEADPSVPASKSREMIAAIRTAGGDARYTEFKGADHVIWDRVYGDAEMWKWLFDQKRGGPASQTQPAKP